MLGITKDAFLTCFDIRPPFDHFYDTSQRCQNHRVCLIAFPDDFIVFASLLFDLFSDAFCCFDHST